MRGNTWRRGPRHREPAELMKPIVDPAAWYPEDYATSQQWIYQLNAAEIAEIDDAVDRIEARGLAMIDVTKTEFDVPTLAAGLAEITDELMEGRGFALIRGLPVEGRSRERPGFYFQLGAETLILGAGTHTMSPGQLESYRRATADADQGTTLRGLVDTMIDSHGFEVGGRHYKRVPRGFPADHPNADLLLHNGLYVGRTVPVPAALHGPGAVEYCAGVYEKMAPLLSWLAPVI